jgi:hypothetical protein
VVKGAIYMSQSQADERYTNQAEFDQLETKLKGELSVFRTSPKDTGTVNAMSIDASFDLTVPDNVLNVTPANTNTGVTTISINGVIKSIKKFDIDKNVFVELEEEDIKKNTPIQLTWDKELDFFVFAPKSGGGNYEKLGYKQPFVLPITSNYYSGLGGYSAPIYTGNRLKIYEDYALAYYISLIPNYPYYGIAKIEYNTGNVNLQNIRATTESGDFAKGCFKDESFIAGNGTEIYRIGKDGRQKASIRMSTFALNTIYYNRTCVSNYGNTYYFVDAGQPYIRFFNYTTGYKDFKGTNYVTRSTSLPLCTKGNKLYACGGGYIASWTINTSDGTLIKSTESNVGLINASALDAVIDENDNIYILYQDTSNVFAYLKINKYKKQPTNQYTLESSLSLGTKYRFESGNRASLDISNNKLYFTGKPWSRFGSTNIYYATTTTCYDLFDFSKKWTYSHIGSTNTNKTPIGVKNEILVNASSPYGTYRDDHYTEGTVQFIVEDISKISKLKEKLE